MPEGLRAVLYCRSAHNSARSMAAQEERCQRKALELGAGQTVTICDVGSVADRLDRPAITELRSLLRGGAVDLVVADAPDRLTRHIADLRTLAQEISRAGARLVFVTP